MPKAPHQPSGICKQTLKPRLQHHHKSHRVPRKAEKKMTTERPHPTTERHETTTERAQPPTERARSSTERTKATKFHAKHECTPKVSNVQECQVSTLLKRPPRSFHIPQKALSKFPTAPHTEVFRHSNKPFKFPYPPETTPKFLHSTKPRFPPTQNELSKFPHTPKEPKKFQRSRTHPRFPPYP